MTAAPEGRTATEPLCDRCGDTGLDPDRYVIEQDGGGNIRHLAEPCSDCRQPVAEARAALFGYIGAGFEEEDCPSFAAALDEYVQAERAAVVSPAVDRVAVRDRIIAAIKSVRVRPELDPIVTSMIQAGSGFHLKDEEALVIADAVLAVLPAAADRATTLRELEQRYRPNTPPSRPDRRRLAAETQQPERCANCGLEVENRGVPGMDGNHRDRWVHIPGGYTICHPQKRDGLRATPAAKEAS